MLRKYYDLHISPEEDDIGRIIALAEKLELAGICIAVRADTKAQLDAVRKEIASFRTPVDVLLGAKISVENPEILRRRIDDLREHADLIIVEGGDLAINRAACENPKVDILSHPSSSRRDSGMDYVMARMAAENRVAIELNFRSVLYSYAKIRVHVLSHLAENVLLARHAGAPVIITTGAKNAWGMRSGRELATLGLLLGLDREKSVRAVSETPQALIERVRDIKSRNHVMPGVRVKKEGIL